jgi:hypothetical protein
MEVPKMLTLAEQEEAHRLRKSEVGTEAGCPFCGVARVSRSDYIRCNGCGVNWLEEEMWMPGYLDRDPRVSRAEAARTARGTKPTVDTSGEGVKG